MIQRILDWIDEAAGGLIRISYLLAGITAVSAYFGAGELPPQIQSTLNFALPWLLAFAVETHTYLTARRVSKAYHDQQSPVLEAHVRSAARTDLLVNLGILVLLVSFSIWNQLNYLLGTWHPASNSLPFEVQLGVRAAAPSLFFMAAAFLAPHAETLGQTINAEGHSTLRAFLRVMRRQRRAMLSRIKKQQVDFSGAIEMVAQAAGERKAGGMIATVQRAIASLDSGQPLVEQPPTVPVLTGTPGDRARATWRKGMGPAELARLANVGASTAKRYVKQFETETGTKLRAVR